jgi:PqqD family protein of HPr-rel-A system
MSSLVAPYWRCVAPDAIVCREWDGEVVVRNERSGSSHLLGPLAGSVLQVLLEADGAVSVGAIAARLGDRPVAVGDSDWCAAIDEVLSEFHRLGLAWPVRP